jgi:chromosomal replication initiation ATPase DnaA
MDREKINTTHMETETRFLPLSRSEIVFLNDALAFYKHLGTAVKLKMKVEKLKSDTNPKTLTPDALINRICAIQGVTIDQLRSRVRKREVVETRQCVSQILSDYFPKFSQARIGMYTNKDHATVIHHMKSVRDIKEVRRLYERLRNELTK